MRNTLRRNIATIILFTLLLEFNLLPISHPYSFSSPSFEASKAYEDEKPRLGEDPLIQPVEKNVEQKADESDWAAPSEYRRRIHITHGQITSNITSFPLLLHLNKSNFHFNRTDSKHIQFYDSQGDTSLPHWVVKWNTSAKEALIWIEVLETSREDNVIWMYYGQGPENEGTTEAIQHQGLVGYWAFEDGTNPTNDWSKYGNDGTINGAEWTNGNVGSGLYFNKSEGDYIDCGNSSIFDIREAITIGAWVRPVDLYSKPKSGDYAGIVAKGSWGDQTYSLRILNSHLCFSVTSGGETYLTVVYNWAEAYDRQWSYVVGRWSMTEHDGTLQLFTNGSEVGHYDVQDSVTAKLDTTIEPLDIGREPRYWNGSLDELQIYDRAVSKDWIKMQYMNYQFRSFSLGSPERRQLKIANIEYNVPFLNDIVVNVTVKDPAGRDTIEAVKLTLIAPNGTSMVKNKSMDREAAIPHGYVFSYTYESEVEVNETEFWKLIVYAKNNVETVKDIRYIGDTTSPSLSILSPNKSLLSTRNVTVTWRGNDKGSGIHHFEIRREEGGWFSVGNTTSYTFSNLRDGSYRVAIKAVDMSGNTVIKSILFIVDATPPEIQILHPASDTIRNRKGEVTITWWTHDFISGIKYARIRITNNREWKRIENATSYTFVGLEEGWHTIILEVVDKNGNAAQKRVNFKLIKPRWCAFLTTFISFNVLLGILVIKRKTIKKLARTLKQKILFEKNYLNGKKKVKN